jgi:DNA/RNA endonuclease G (NUC1)
MNIGLVIVAFLIAFIFVAIIFRLWGRSYVASQPTFTWDVRVVEKRQQLTGNRENPKQAYYITFEFRDGSRKEYQVKLEDYERLLEEDLGKLYTQANQFKGFE